METVILGIVYAMLLLINFIINLKRGQLDNNKHKHERRVSANNKTRASRFQQQINRFNNN
jgi:hypothetical protein